MNPCILLLESLNGYEFRSAHWSVAHAYEFLSENFLLYSAPVWEMYSFP
jgi:hypothetical protein